MSKLKINEAVLKKTVQRCRERNIIIPTFAQQKDPTLVPEKIKERLKDVGMWDLDPANLFRITWKNEPIAKGGGFNNGNWVEFPSELTGVPARIIGIAGKYFPTGAHKVGAAFGCLVPRLVTGEFDPTSQKAVWPSTGNYCRGGSFDCALLACDAIAILPEEMSEERFNWLKDVGTSEIFATPGCESNVKEIYDKCWELRDSRGDDILIFNQFEESGNSIWHYHMTGGIIEEIYEEIRDENSRFAGYVTATGSAGTIAAGDYLRTKYPHLKVVGTEALQCPTLLQFGYGGHRIEGIGDKHVPWVHNVRNTDMICAVDDEQTMSLMRLFNEETGIEYLQNQGVKSDLLDQLHLLGISSICNLVSAIKTARYYEMNGQDLIFVPLTDSMEMYQSRMNEQNAIHGAYNASIAGQHFGRYIEGIGIDNMRELNYYDKKSLHNFKYFTWVEQQGKTVEELNALWEPEFWTEMFGQIDEWETLINEFNDRVGLLAKL